MVNVARMGLLHEAQVMLHEAQVMLHEAQVIHVLTEGFKMGMHMRR